MAAPDLRRSGGSLHRERMKLPIVYSDARTAELPAVRNAILAIPSEPDD